MKQKDVSLVESYVLASALTHPIDVKGIMRKLAKLTIGSVSVQPLLDRLTNNRLLQKTKAGFKLTKTGLKAVHSLYDVMDELRPICGVRSF